MTNYNANNEKYVSLSFDIEDWFQVESFKTVFPRESWDNLNLRVEIGTDKILKLLDKYNIKATFFILGWIAERKPHLIKKIYDQGHEIASHGYYHQLNYNMCKVELYKDLKDSKKLLEKIINEDVQGYRAPTFSVSDEVIEVLGSLEYKYDSSYNQFSKHDRYGELNNCNQENVFEANSLITEITLPAVKVLKQEIPIAGGGFFRLYPLWLTKQLVNKHFQKNNYYVFYAHPWEFDENMPIISNVEMSNKFRHYVNVKSNFNKLENFIKYLQSINSIFLPIKDYLNLRL